MNLEGYIQKYIDGCKKIYPYFEKQTYAYQSFQNNTFSPIHLELELSNRVFQETEYAKIKIYTVSPFT